MADLIGQEIGNYRLITRLASGGFGNVYLAQHTLLPERKVAIKLLHTFLSSQEERDQFLQEARFLEQLKHPHILPLIDVGVSDNLPYLVTEYAAGGSLRDLLKQHQSPGLPQDMALIILSEICKALQYAHQRQVIHRDLKPAINMPSGVLRMRCSLVVNHLLRRTSLQWHTNMQPKLPFLPLNSIQRYLDP